MDFPLRPPEQVMRLARMGSFFATRLSFMPSLLRQMAAEDWRIERTRWDMDADGFGRAVYCAKSPEWTYSLVAFSNDLDPKLRSDRVIAEAWDSSFVLFDGEPSDDDLDRLAQNTPRQEAGRYLPSELVLSRANKSARFFSHVVARLASGRQPDLDLLGSIGYLMRTTAVYGNGKFGVADRAKIARRPAMSGPFRAELLTVYLIRAFTHDLVEHIARCRSPESFAPLHPDSKRHLGIGNATGLGMAPFLVSHPILIHKWMHARETALARVRGQVQTKPECLEHFWNLLDHAQQHVAEWSVPDARQTARIVELRKNLDTLRSWLDADPDWGSQPSPWDQLYRRVEAKLSLEAQELVVSLLVEVHGDLVDELAETMSTEDHECHDPTMSVRVLKQLVQQHYAWALEVDLSKPESQQRFWYVSEEKLEPRFGDRFQEEGAEKEMPHALAREFQHLWQVLEESDLEESTAVLMLRYPEVRRTIRRMQTVARHPYAEIRDNLVAADCLPIDLLRCKLSFFGASKFDPKSDLWTRINLYQGAPLPEDLKRRQHLDWNFPVLPQAVA